MTLDFNSLDSIKAAGFTGFKTMATLLAEPSVLPLTKGVYLVLNLDATPIRFLPKGAGGFFKGRDQNVTLEQLKQNWIMDTLVIYIGKAGGNGQATLRSRIKQYLAFGNGKAVGHWGGRFIWQIAASQSLVICWKSIGEGDPRAVEADLIKKFIERFGARPFANLIG
ncbi:hypothetical protein [Chitinophaga rhizophila]|uniref:GIY-YIG domain-containing protein n=1 Tax=Chitinophaga rhizophila TaxID=2866212 RepID=A0ABS7GML3_9BACT|nr:hypothetical protein [Chitinophaga rhizophila]MBW8687913.1 hypothetical protein [Chitinophaga rhizophila]